MKYPVNEPIRTSPFGQRGNEFHLGTDWISRSGSRDLIAVTDGVVVARGEKPKLDGWFVTIRFDYIDGRTFDGHYAHMAGPADVGVGVRVTEGQIVGQMGNSGRASGVHLHFGVFLDGRWVDPELFLDTFRQAKDDEEVYRIFHRVFSQKEPSKQDVINFRRAGFPWESEFKRVRKERGCQ